ncbi:unnamed protein product [Rotaria sp. Silwood1]|nr:unnamed protein product [Rotaria sp. Silwood1]CAF3441183.1 unnamed protein product [Rotaria sp. Silwood1]CAF4507772.1 unnamed protein product [Rotaria sp. Silwood1]CAF4588235.1 unnamed protein product [Rotaria sp. Silwood1]CAF4899282.1 unnamed protein product [Rotaria sp. Silwood1]
MAQSFDICEHMMLGQAIADNFQASTDMALSLGKSLQKYKAFKESSVMSHYLYLYHLSKPNVGETTKLVYQELKATITKAPNKLTREQFKFPIEKIKNASQSAHEQLKGLSSGCNPALRSFPLACCPWINDDTLFQIACDEAQLTHYSNTAAQVSGLTNLICRRLIKGDEWADAIKAAFTTVPNLLGEIQEIQHRYQNDTVLNSRVHAAYAPNTLHTALYCVTKADSFESALKHAYELDKLFCPILVGILAGARWGVPLSMLDRCPKDKLNEIHQIAKCFTDEWTKQLENGHKKTISSLLKLFP